MSDQERYEADLAADLADTIARNGTKPTKPDAAASERDVVELELRERLTVLEQWRETVEPRIGMLALAVGIGVVLLLARIIDAVRSRP